MAKKLYLIFSGFIFFVGCDLSSPQAGVPLADRGRNNDDSVRVVIRRTSRFHGVLRLGDLAARSRYAAEVTREIGHGEERRRNG